MAEPINCDVVTVACAVCGAQKREANHWWMAWVNNLGEFCSDVYSPVTWEGIRSRYEIRAVACGEEHAQQLYARWLVARNFLAPSQRPGSSGTGSQPVQHDAQAVSLRQEDSSTPQEET